MKGIISSTGTQTSADGFGRTDISLHTPHRHTQWVDLMDLHFWDESFCHEPQSRNTARRLTRQQVEWLKEKLMPVIQGLIAEMPVGPEEIPERP